MIDIENWLKIFSERLEKSFGNRIDFIGIQGSCSRGEADDKSDIDVVVIFDKLTADDLKKYDEGGFGHRIQRQAVRLFIGQRRTYKLGQSRPFFSFILILLHLKEI